MLVKPHGLLGSLLSLISEQRGKFYVYWRDLLFSSIPITRLLTSEFFKLTVPATLGAIFSLDGLERGAGNSGVLIRWVSVYQTDLLQS